jgi:hypothetical protein
MEYVVKSLCSLFLAIIRCEDCWDILREKDCIFLDETGGLPIHPFELLKEDFGGRTIACPDYHMVIETSLFSYPWGTVAKTYKKEVYGRVTQVTNSRHGFMNTSTNRKIR